MATSPVHILVSNMIEESIERLKNDLKPLEFQMKDLKEGMYITHNNDKIAVYASLRFKAYIPKKYDGWDVLFVEWDGQSEIQLDLDFEIDISI